MTITDRINQLLLENGVKSRSIRPTLARICGISYSAVSQWYSGTTGSIKHENLQAIAKAYGSSVDWLLTGSTPKHSETLQENFRSELTPDQPNAIYHPMAASVPLINWTSVDHWCSSAVSAGATEIRMACPDEIGPRGFALAVEGDAMRNPNANEDSYPNSTIIFVDPDMKGSVGSPVLVLQPREAVPIFRILTRDAGKDILKPLNPQYPIIMLGEEDKVLGVVIGYYRKPAAH
ncbi:S24 family peptidase [Pseudomonas sp. RC4D1]|uniref:LexA family protein n=1 Tax=Pseudomonas sp. RC4D1 TaxID=2834407 RepID=UPI001BD0A5DA|nr:S24 family peptidase [Pseudomonas sp. RC4D1]